MRNSSLLTNLLELIEKPDCVDGATLARTLTRLTEHEVEAGGPYADGTDDVGLNLAVAVFLGMHDVRLPKLDAFIESHELRSDLVDDETLRWLAEKNSKLRNAKNGTEALPNESEAKLFDRVRAGIRTRLAGLPSSFVQDATEVIERTIRGNPDKQMTLMPLYMREAFGANGKRFSDERLAELSLANVFFWTAFIIYDDFWDEDEAAEPKLLPIANLFARHYVQVFENALPPEFFHTLMDKLDAANAWEMTSCRLVRDGNRIRVPDTLPNYGDFLIKFYPAAGHVLGPLAMLTELGYAVDSDEAANLIDYFRYYLVAMQLNDDAHDWKEDLERGHISTAVSVLLAAWKRVHPERKEVDLVKDMPELERLFWFETIAPIAKAALGCTARSRKALDSLTCVTNPEPLERFITLNERIAHEALSEHQKSVDFLKAL